VEEALHSHPATAVIDHARAVERYAEMMRERETAQRHEILISMREAAVAFESRIRQLSAAQNLQPVMMAGSPRRKDDSWLTVTRFEQITGDMDVPTTHAIRMEGADVTCVSVIDGHSNEYYRGPVADSTRLREEVEGHAGTFFAHVLNVFVRKVEANRSFLDLFE
jgi:hypothetical protein